MRSFSRHCKKPFVAKTKKFSQYSEKSYRTFSKKPQTLYRRLWFQEFFIFFRLFSSFSIRKFRKIWSSENFLKISQKIFFPHLPLENFLQCRAALAARISSNTLRVANQGPLSPEQIKTFPRTYAIYMLHP